MIITSRFMNGTDAGRKLSARSARASGFTLLELVIALTILALLSGMVFGIVRTSVRTAYDMQHMQQENDQVNRFIALCRQTFQNLPSTATITLTVTQPGDPMIQELTISGAPETFSFGINPMSYKDTIVSLRPDLAATEASEEHLNIFNLCISRADLIPKDSSDTNQGGRIGSDGNSITDDQGRIWMPLLPDVVSLTWRAYKEDDDSWQEEWSSVDFPPLMEMNLKMEGRSQPTRMVFSLPTTKLTQADPALAPKKAPVVAGPVAAAGAAGAAAGQPGARGAKGQGDTKGQGGKGQRGGPPGGGAPRGGPPGAGAPKGGSGAAPATGKSSGGAPASGGGKAGK